MFSREAPIRYHPLVSLGLHRNSQVGNNKYTLASGGNDSLHSNPDTGQEMQKYKGEVENATYYNCKALGSLSKHN